MTRFGLTLCLLAHVLMPTLGVAQAESQKQATDRPALWEFGVGGGGRVGPDYPAADEYNFKGIALPYVVYRGPIWRLGDGGILRGVFLESERVELDLSLDGAFPAKADNNRLRQGMEDLDYLAQIGPRVGILLKRWDDMAVLKLNLQTRAVFSSDFKRLDSRGYVFNPELVYRKRPSEEFPFSLKLAMGPTWSTDKLQKYFYAVPDEYVTETRPGFDAGSGYLGSEVSCWLSRKLTNTLHLHFGGSIGYWAGAANRQSPLYAEDFTASIGFALRWVFYESSERVGSERE